MRGNFEDIIGKTIVDVHCRENDRTPRGQIFLVFDDDTYFEIYGDNNIRGASGLDKGNIDTVKSCQL